ncbi:hypothetical protein ACFQZZ_29855 [Nocardia sp. GCM10030253]|uniref:hypothetical protein n=1 Tax=Nocardia sp. GCM10030253 TaxID=3273404 RepID=UPI00362509F5
MTFTYPDMRYAPLLSRMAANIVALGLDEERLWNSVRRFEAAGDRTPNIRRVPLYHVIKHHGRATIKRRQPFQLLADTLNKGIDRFPLRVLGRPPSWAADLTYEPVAK